MFREYNADENNSALLMEKYNYAKEMCKSMSQNDFNCRPNCNEILAKGDLWAFSRSEMYTVSDFNKETYKLYEEKDFIGEALRRNFKNMDLKQILKIKRKCALTGKSIPSKLNYSKKYSADKTKKILYPNPASF